MGKKQHSKDRLFITQTEHKYLYGGKKEEIRRAYRRLPFDCCSITLTSFKNPVCTREGHVFDLEAIVPFLQAKKMNPVNGEPMTMKDLIKLKYSKNAEEKYFCPVTFKTFTNNSKIAAIATSGNVFSYSAIEELNIKNKNWVDLISGEKFKRKDIIILQDPQDLTNREIENFEHLRAAQNVASSSRNGQDTNIRSTSATERIMKEVEAKKEQKRKRKEQGEGMTEAERAISKITHSTQLKESETADGKKLKYSKFTDGKCSTSFTSTTFQPTTKNVAAVASDDEVLKIRWAAVKKMKKKGYVKLVTNFGDINLELDCDFVPMTCDNFLSLCENKYYVGTTFHRIIRGFMMQGGDPTGTGRGGESIWGKKFPDEPDSRLNHVERGVLSMANSGKNTNGSQFFITLKPCQHLDYKHTIFGRVVGGKETLGVIESLPTGAEDRPTEPVEISSVQVLVNPFKEYEDMEATGRVKVEEPTTKVEGTVMKVGGKWVAYDEVLEMPEPKPLKPERSGVGKYLKLNKTESPPAAAAPAPAKVAKKVEFKDFSGW